MTETWRSTPICADFEVSNLGRVRRPNGLVLKTWALNTTGYLQVQALDRRKHLVHRLVASAFVDGFRTGLVVNHKNGDRADNRSENLEWVTRSENERHSYRVLGKVNYHTGKTSAEHPTSKAIIAKNLATGEVQRFACALDAIRAGIGTDSGQISRCCTGQAQSHKGYAFAFGANHGVVFHDSEDRI